MDNGLAFELSTFVAPSIVESPKMTSQDLQVHELAKEKNAVLLVQDDLLEALFPGEIPDIHAFVECHSRLKKPLGPHVCALLPKGISVVQISRESRLP